MAIATAESGRYPQGIDSMRISGAQVRRAIDELVHRPFEGRQREIPDGYRGLRGVLITGDVGVGKTSLARLVAEDLETTNVVVFGDIIRGIRQRVLGFVPRGESFDRALEAGQQKMIALSSINHPLVADGRCAPLNMALLRQKEEIKQEKQLKAGKLTEENLRIPYDDIVCIVLSAPEEVRRERLVSREQKDHPELSADEIWRESLDRSNRDLQIYRKLHPLIGQHPTLGETTPFDPRLTDYGDRPLFDIHIDNTSMKLPEERAVVRRELQKLGFYIPERKIIRPPRRGIIFPPSDNPIE